MVTNVRAVTNADEPALAQLAEATRLFPASALAEMIAPALTGAASDLWRAAEQDGRLVGFAFAEPEKFTDGTWNLRAIGTDPDARRQGIGSVLLAAVEAGARDTGARLLLIETSDAADQDAARAFYRGRGYYEAAHIADFWEDGVAKVIFLKRLLAG